MAAWNALLVISPLLLVALAGETYFRLTRPFIENSIPYRFVDGVGAIRKPNAEARHANWRDDNFVVSHTNSQGFLDREPVSAERAAAGCHIAFIGDSFVDAMEVPIADKFHVRLEEMAARELPRLSITTQAYGIRGTGQINQFPFYDEYARRLSPNLVVLVFFVNDFMNNSPAMYSLRFGVDPDRLPFMSAQKDAHGTMKLRPPDPEFERFLLPRTPMLWYKSIGKRLTRVSHFAKWLDTKVFWVGSRAPPIDEWANMIADRPCCALDGWRPRRGGDDLSLGIPFTKEHLPPILDETLEYTAFGIEQFKRRTDRDGAKLAILAPTSYMGTRGDPQFDRLSAIAEPLGIPIISDYDYIINQGHHAIDGHFRFDIHWNATGHQWAAEAVLEWLKENQDVCD